MKRTGKEKGPDSACSLSSSSSASAAVCSDRPGDTEDAMLKTTTCQDELGPHLGLSHFLLPPVPKPPTQTCRPVWREHSRPPEGPKELSSRSFISIYVTGQTDTTFPAEPGSHDRPVKRRSLEKAALEGGHDSSDPKRQSEEDTKDTPASTHQGSGSFPALDPVQPLLYPTYHGPLSGPFYQMHPPFMLPRSPPYSYRKPTDIREAESCLSRLHEEMEIARKELKQLNLHAAEMWNKMEKVGWNQDLFDKEDTTGVVPSLSGPKVQFSPVSELRSSDSSKSTETSCRSSAVRDSESVKAADQRGRREEDTKDTQGPKTVHLHRVTDLQTHRAESSRPHVIPESQAQFRETMSRKQENQKLSEVREKIKKWEAQLRRIELTIASLEEKVKPLLASRMEEPGWNQDQFDKEDNKCVVPPLSGLKETPKKPQLLPWFGPVSELRSSGSSETSCRSSAVRDSESVKEQEAAGAPEEKLKRSSESDPPRDEDDEDDEDDEGVQMSAEEKKEVDRDREEAADQRGRREEDTKDAQGPKSLHLHRVTDLQTHRAESSRPHVIPGFKAQFRETMSRKDQLKLYEVRKNIMKTQVQLLCLQINITRLKMELNSPPSFYNSAALRWPQVNLLRKGRGPGWERTKTGRRTQAQYHDTDHDLHTVSELRSSGSSETSCRSSADRDSESVKEQEAAGAPEEKLKRSSESDPPRDEDDEDVQTSAEEKKEVDRDREEAADPAQDTASEQPAEGALHGRDGPLMMSQHVSASSAQPPRSDPQNSTTESRSRPGSASWSSPSQPGSDRTSRRAVSLPDMKPESSLEEFTPEFREDGDDEEYSFHCCCPGLFRCRVTGLVFHMQGGGDVFYRLVPWDRSLLAPLHKKPAGPLFDIKCPQQRVSQLHLPHCEIRSTGGRGFLSVVHLNGDGVEFIPPHRVTDTHVIINVTGFSAYGNVKDEDSPPDPVQALVLLFYRTPEDPDLPSFLSVLLLPRNVVIRDIQRSRKKLVGPERFIETSPHCKLKPKQLYALSTDPEDDLVLVQPTEAEFDEDYNNNYFPVFQVILQKIFKHMKLLLKDSESSNSVWERRVFLQSTGVTSSSGSTGLSLRPHERLRDVRSSLMDGISAPVLSGLLDKLLEKRVLTEAERESAEEKPNRRDRAGSVIDTVRRKGEAASSEMIHFLCEVDPFLCKHLGLS